MDHQKTIIYYGLDNLMIRPAKKHEPAQIKSRPPIETITKREKEVIQYICKGMKNKPIARAMGIKEQTVRDYVYSIFNKCGASNRVELALQFLKEI